MQVTIVTFGSRGDVQPFLHLAMGFREAGHRVRLCTHGMFAELVGDNGIEFVAFGRSDPKAAQKADYENRPKTKAGVLWRLLRRSTRPDWEELEQLERVVAGAELVICNHLADATYHAAEKWRVRCAFAYLHPTHPTRCFASTLLPQGISAGRRFNLLTHRALRHFYWLKNRGWINEWRTRRLGLRRISLLGPFGEQYKHRVPYIFGFSPTLIPAIDDWPEWYRMTGYWFQPRSAAKTSAAKTSKANKETSGEQVPFALRRFVDAGDPPVVIAFGSVASPLLPWIVEETVNGIQRRGARALLVTGWGEHSLTEREGVFITPSASYEWLFRRASLVIHAGGSGTVAEVTRAGVPSIPVPFAAEQRFWSHHLWKLGIAAKPIQPRHVTAASIAAALVEIELRDGMRQRARELARTIEAEGGVAAAVDFLCAGDVGNGQVAAAGKGSAAVDGTVCL